MITKIKTNDEIREYTISGNIPDTMYHDFECGLELEKARSIALIEYRIGVKAEVYDINDELIAVSAFVITEEIWELWLSAGLEVTPL